MRAATATILLYAVFVLFTIEDVLSLGVKPTEFQRQYVFGVPTRDIGLAVALLAFVCWFPSISKRVKAVHLACFAALLAAYLTLGIWNYGASNQLNGDVRVALWFLGGISVAFLLHKTSAPGMHLRVLLAAFTGCMVLASLFSERYYVASFGYQEISHPEVYVFSRFAAGPIILLANLSGPSVVAKALPLTCLGAFVLCSAVLTGTRSQLIVAVGIAILVLRSFSIRSHGDVTGLRVSVSTAEVIVGLLTVVGLAFLAISLDEGRLTRFATIAQPAALLGDPRAGELRSFWNTSTSTQLFFGRGLGGAVVSPIYRGGTTPVMHVGIMNVWLKLGLVPFAAAVVWIYGVLPTRYFKSVRRLRRYHGRTLFRDVARVVVWPALLPWMLWSILSGGFSEQESLFLGWVYFMSRSVARSGLAGWLAMPRRRWAGGGLEEPSRQCAAPPTPQPVVPGVAE